MYIPIEGNLDNHVYDNTHFILDTMTLLQVVSFIYLELKHLAGDFI